MVCLVMYNTALNSVYDVVADRLRALIHTTAIECGEGEEGKVREKGHCMRSYLKKYMNEQMKRYLSYAMFTGYALLSSDVLPVLDGHGLCDV